ncbi:preprotein translocase subunit SecE [Alkaliphilus hydrothermalis]|uniref:Protein translocase subunit SecE n=2 Tax=Alkaliphilus hydrothermalis TaxID=1482730 RepID=A0ABS2NRA6_9FIRM|nr:preprotein translocase subunit SecE [Alkaliphilus hydrothermalis]
MSTHANTNNEKRGNASKYLKGVKSELKKVNWPSRKDLKNHTALVVGAVAVATAMLWVFDTAFGFGLSFILK